MFSGLYIIFTEIGIFKVDLLKKYFQHGRARVYVRSLSPSGPAPGTPAGPGCGQNHWPALWASRPRPSPRRSHGHSPLQAAETAEPGVAGGRTPQCSGADRVGEFAEPPGLPPLLTGSLK